MAGPPPYSDSESTPGSDPNAATTTGMPRWVKVFGIVAIIVVLLAIVVMLVGGGDHGPGRHLSSGDARSSVTTT